VATEQAKEEVMRFSVLLVFMGTFLFGSEEVSAQSTCPPDHPASRAWIEGYLVHANFAAHRDSLGIGGLGTSEVRLLTDSADLVACQWLVSTFGAYGSHPNWYWSAYRVGSYYAVAWRYVNTNGGIRIGLTPMLIFDTQFRQVGGFAS
jgi:hypothetical protein